MSDTPQQAEVRAAEEARRLAMSGNDPDALAPLLCDELIYTHSSGLRDSKTSWLARISSGALRYGGVEFADPIIRVIDRTAIVAGRMNAIAIRGGQPVEVISVYLAVWVQRPEGWRLLAIQGTPPPPASA